MDKEMRADAPSNWAKVNKVYIYSKAPGPHMLNEHGSAEEAIKRFIKVCSGFQGIGIKILLMPFLVRLVNWKIVDSEETDWEAMEDLNNYA